MDGPGGIGRGDSEDERPGWLVAAEPEPDDLSRWWPRILAFVSRHASESGRFDATSDAWLLRTGLSMGASLVVAERLVALGALEFRLERLYVVRWREDYRDLWSL